MKVGIVDFGFNNLNSIYSAIKYLGYNPEIVDKKNTLENFNTLILPGVGSYSNAMNFLKKNKLDTSIKNFAKNKKPILGICLGMQILFEGSEEFGKYKGLGILKGNIKSLKKIKSNLQVPNIGWYNLEKNKMLNNNKLIKFDKKKYVYFIHSYFADPKSEKIISSYIDIKSKKICASIENENIFATQFHPEKSGSDGINILKNFLSK